MKTERQPKPPTVENVLREIAAFLDAEAARREALEFVDRRALTWEDVFEQEAA